MKRFLILIIIPLFLLLRFDNTVITVNHLYANLNKVTNLTNYQNKNCKTTSFLTAAVVTGEVLTGFTLAEVLITLLIIGIVASLVVPGLINDTQNQESVTSLKKFYGEFQQGTKLVMAKHSCSTLECTGYFVNTSNHDYYSNISKFLNEVFGHIRDCKSVNCKNQNDIKTVDGTHYSINGHNVGFNIDSYQYILPNGTIIGLSPFTGWGNDICTSTYGGCSLVTVDINGEKKPNTWGRDIFLFYLSKNGVLKPSNYLEYLGQNYLCNPTTNSTRDSIPNGADCSYRIMKDNWQMNY